MEVTDHHGHRLPAISAAVKDARHVVHVENLSSLTQNAKVHASLPNGVGASVEFTPPGGAHFKWDDTKSGFASGVIVDFQCKLRKLAGRANSGEPLQCDDVEDAVGSVAFSPATSGVPFAMTMPVT